jgi:hypothetical protein
MTDDGTLRFLLKGRLPGPSMRLAIGANGAKLGFTAQPLFRSIGISTGLGAAPTESQWFVVKSEIGVEANPWDACHALMTAGSGNPSGIQFVEPDLVQRWPVRVPPSDGGAFAMREGRSHPQNAKDFPAVAVDNYWFRDADHSQFAAALATVSDPGDGKRTRIAHLDTGFDPDHLSRPIHLSKSEQRNFVEADAPADARDRSAGLFNAFSHGTGTLSILAGAPVEPGKGWGCAPFAEVIPVRVADAVVLFRNSAIARAFDYVHDLCRNASTRVHIITMSMGGVPSKAWAEAVNALYNAGVFIVTAAGNNYGNAPTHLTVYPARFKRVVAACGVMSDGKPYADLKASLMAGNYGPDEKLPTAIAAYTPNVPWARFGQRALVDFDGEGTSAATPQVAGAAALWIQKYRASYDGYPQPWMRVEAVRKALFDHAANDQVHRGYFGTGKLRVLDALAAAPAAAKDLKPQPEDNTDFAIVKVLFGMHAAPSVPGRAAMVELELHQILQAKGLETQLQQSDDPRVRARVVDELLSTNSASKPLQEALRGSASAPVRVTRRQPADTAMSDLHLKMALGPKVPRPPVRRLRVFAYDPSLQTDPLMFGINEAIVAVPWERIEPGPVGEYLEVIDVDPASQSCYAPVDLNHPHILSERGLAPSEANPQFHQQMVYAVAMRTIDRFERALGRRALWAERTVRDANGAFVSCSYVQRLRIYPHALREENAYYSSEKMALLFGYFPARDKDTGTTLPGSEVFCAVSHDIVAHETTHALLDGLHPRFQEGTNPDVHAFHEAFADIVALFQHFTMPEALLQQVKRTRGTLQEIERTRDNPEERSLLGELAVQFGKSTGMHGALRSAIGRAKSTDYSQARSDGEPHALGAVLVSAVFAAFMTIYRARSADLLRLATNGTGIVPAGEISHDLALRLAAEAAKVAEQVLNMCIRALDYCPPVDINFGDYLRAIITADRDLVPLDDRGYRVAFISAFRDRGIFPQGVAHLAEDSLVWETPPLDPDVDADLIARFKELIEDKLDLTWSLNTNRRTAYQTSRRNAAEVHGWLAEKAQQKLLYDVLSFEPPSQNPPPVGDLKGEMRPFEVHSVRPARRTSPDGSTHPFLVIELTQTFRAKPDQARYRGGCTMLVDLNTNEPRYIIRKRLRGQGGAVVQKRARAAAAELAAALGLQYAAGEAGGTRDLFALLHRFAPRT